MYDRALSGEQSRSRTRFLEKFHEFFLFFKCWASSPLRLGAVMPSSKALAREVARRVLWDVQDSKEYVVELGAGTGRFTQELLDQGLAPERLFVVEVDYNLYCYLKTRFPRVNVVWGNAAHLTQLIPEAVHRNVAVVLSGIPMMNLSPFLQKEIVESSFQLLKIGGKMFQFTYSPFSSIPAHSLKLRQRRHGTVFRNFPPATIWSYEKC